MVGVEAAGDGISSGKHAATLAGGSKGVLHGMKTFLIQSDQGRLWRLTPSRRSRLPRRGPEHSFLKDSGAPLLWV